MSRQDRHDGVSCDVCSRNNFRGKRYKCLSCDDYDLCANCYENGEVTLAHLTTHPMQVVLTRNDFDLYFRGESISHERAQSFTCASCGRAGLTDAALYEHIRSAHADAPISGANCPLCVASWRGDPNRKPDDLLLHLAVDHRLGSPADVDRHQAAFATFFSRHAPPSNRSNADSQRATATEQQQQQRSSRTYARAATENEPVGLTRSGAFRMPFGSASASASVASSLRAPGSYVPRMPSTAGTDVVMRRRIFAGQANSMPDAAASSTTTGSSTTLERRHDPDAMSALAEELFGVGTFTRNAAANQSQSTAAANQLQQPPNAAEREQVQAEHDALAELLAQLEGRLSGRTDIASLTLRMEQSILHQLESRQYEQSTRSSGLSSRSSQAASAVPVSLPLSANVTAAGRQPVATSQQQAAAASTLMHALLGGATEQALAFTSNTVLAQQNSVPMAQQPTTISRQLNAADSPFLLMHTVSEQASRSAADSASQLDELSVAQLVVSALYDSLVHEPNVNELVSFTDAFERDLLGDITSEADWHPQEPRPALQIDGSLLDGGQFSETLHTFDAAAIAASPTGLFGAVQPTYNESVRGSSSPTSWSESALQRDNINNNGVSKQQQRFVTDSLRVTTRKTLEQETNWRDHDVHGAQGSAGGADDSVQQPNLVHPPLAQ